MKINVDLNAKSIQNAINALKTAERQLNEQMLNDFLIGACEWIKTQANTVYLSASTIGSEVKADIESGWVIGTPMGGKITMTNTADKAVYVEFGVGVVGEQEDNRHKNATDAGYKYNVPSESKSASGRWVFAIEDKSLLDLPTGSYKEKQAKDKNLAWIITKGTKATMYAYNAVVDCGNFGAKEVWQKIKVKYWG